MFRFWPVLFFIIPVIEIYLIIEVGGVIGAGWTILLILLTGIIGVGLLRQQGLSTLMRANQAMSQGQIPAMEMMEGIFLAVGGALLITPGFFTDVLGFICLLRPSRRVIIRYLLLNSSVASSYSVHQETRSRNDSRTIEGEYHRDD